VPSPDAALGTATLSTAGETSVVATELCGSTAPFGAGATEASGAAWYADGLAAADWRGVSPRGGIVNGSCPVRRSSITLAPAMLTMPPSATNAAASTIAVSTER
jgi:hypothetical protein